MRLTPETPTRMRIHLDDSDSEQELRTALTYKDQRVSFELKKMKKAFWFKDKFGDERWKEEIDRLKSEETKCLLFLDKVGLWTYTGLAHVLLTRFRTAKLDENQFETPEPAGWKFPWNKEPKLTPHEFQSQSKEALLKARHAGVQIGTGLGKSFIIVMLLKALGLRSVVMAPSKDIAHRLFEDLTEAFGAKNVGFFGDGKKHFQKLITVGIGASLTRIKPDSPAWKSLSKTQVFIADESHQCPASTLESVCHGLVANAPWRFFFSATQLRTDGLSLLLEGITGPIVYEKTVREGIAEGFLARLNFFMFEVESPVEGESYDANENTRDHLYYNKNVLTRAGWMINNFVKQGKRVLVLVEELEQLTRLLPYLKTEVRFAHGGVTKENKTKLPEAFHDSDPSQLVKQFNNEEFPVLVGTSCVATGTDVKANEVTIYLQGGKSEIQVLQGACGRSTRLFTFKDGTKKTDCIVVDFRVVNISSVKRHADARQHIYEDIAPVQVRSL